MQILVYILTYLSYGLIVVAVLSILAERFRMLIIKTYFRIVHNDLRDIRYRAAEYRSEAYEKSPDQETSREQRRADETKWFTEQRLPEQFSIKLYAISELLDRVMIADVHYSIELETIAKNFKLMNPKISPDR